jgi:hypothetical protein
MAKKPSQMSPSEYRAAMIAKRKNKKDERTNASEFANLGSAKGMQKETNKARNAGRSANLGTGNPMKSRGADPSNLAGKGGRGTGLNLAKKTKTPDEMAAAAKTKRDFTAKITAAEKKPSKTPSTKSRNKDGLGTKAKSAAKKYNVGVSKGGVSFGKAFDYYRGLGNKTFTWNGKKYTTEVAKAKPKAKVSTPTPADFTMTSKKSAPKSKDPRGNQIKATPGKKGPLASARKEYPVTGPGSQSKILRPKKAAAKIPAGAKTFKGSYDSKKFKLQNINGETYVVPRGK